MTELNAVVGDTPAYRITFTDSSGNAIDISGYDIYFTVKSALTDADADAVIAIKDVAPGGSVNGQIIIPLSSADTDLTPGTYFCDIKYKTPDNAIKTFVWGKITFWPTTLETLT